MRISRFLTDVPVGSTPAEGESLKICGQEFHHLKSVLRLGVGDEVEAIALNEAVNSESGQASFTEGKARSFLCKIQALEKDHASVLVLKELTTPNFHPIHAIIGLPKQKTAELIVEKLVELGVSSICFFEADHSDVKLAKAKIQRLKDIAISALKQSGSAVFPRIRLFDDLKEALEKTCSERENALLLALSAPERSYLEKSEDQKQAPKITSFFEEQKTEPYKNKVGEDSNLENMAKCDESYLLIGPEGGFSPAEKAICESYRFQNTSLGPSVLRTETAAILGCAIVQLLRST